MRDLPTHVKDYHEFLLSLINADANITKKKLNQLFYERFPQAILHFDDALAIDHHLFGFNLNSWWRNAHALPEENDLVSVLNHVGRATNVGVFTFSIDFQAISSSSSS